MAWLSFCLNCDFMGFGGLSVMEVQRLGGVARLNCCLNCDFRGFGGLSVMEVQRLGGGLAGLLSEL